MNCYTLLEQAALRFPDQGAVYRGTNSVMTFADWHDRVKRLSAALARVGEPGDRVVVASKNDPELLVVMFATWCAGMVLAPLNAKLHVREMADIIEDAEPSWIFAAKDLVGPLGKLSGSRRTIGIGTPEYQSLFSDALPDAAAATPDSLAWLFYTSGTTGRSKGAMLSHRNLLAMTIAHLSDFETLTEHDSIIHAAPMSHGSGLYILPYLARAARQVIPDSAGFDPDEFLDLSDVHPGCGAFLAPTMVHRLRRAVEAGRDRQPNVRSIVYGGGPMYLDEIKRSLQVFGPVFRQLYGQGEAPMTITGLRQRDFDNPSDVVLESVGWPRSGVEVRVLDAEGRPSETGCVGEIVCRGDVVMGGYWRNAEATAATLRDGWLYTGDLGSMDSRGMLTLKDRSKEVIISGGTNIYPREIEEVLLSHPEVLEVAVIGEPDEEWGENVVAVVVTELGAGVTTDDLDLLCQARIARFKRPKRYLFVDALPKSGYGKVLKRELKEALLSKTENRAPRMP